jgi:hypothetical protein
LPPIDFTRRTALYRLYDADSALLYVGIAFDPEARMPGHKRKPWWPLVASKTIEWHDTRLLALTAEARVVGTENPLYNVLGVARPMPIPTGKPSRSSGQAVVRVDNDLWEAYGSVCKAKGLGSRAVGIRMHIAAAVAEFERKGRREARAAAKA